MPCVCVCVCVCMCVCVCAGGREGAAAGPEAELPSGQADQSQSDGQPRYRHLPGALCHSSVCAADAAAANDPLMFRPNPANLMPKV